MTRNFREMLEARQAEGKLTCLGLDSDYEKIPPSARMSTPAKSQVQFNHCIVGATKDQVCAYKLNLGPYSKQGAEGIMALRETIADINEVAPGVATILDAKYGDIGNSNKHYAATAFDYFGADAVTVNPYFGGEALEPFFERTNKGIFVLCRTSNQGAGEFQDLISDHKLLYQRIAHNFARHWNKNGNCGLVVGATYPQELREVRRIVGDNMPILSPGIGAQGGDLEGTVTAGKDSRGVGIIVNAGSSSAFASNDANYAEATRRDLLRINSLINQYRQ
jgi:orotidine-5'-phosphate decarboxylase